MSRPDLEGAIVGHTLVDYALTKALQSRLQLTHSGKTFKLTPPRSFGNKLALAREIELISKELADNLKYMALIRNEFAHNLFASSFDTREISKWCRSLDLPENFRRLADWRGASTQNNYQTGEAGGLPCGIFVTNKYGWIIANASFTGPDLQSNKGRFLISVKLAWALIGLISDE